MGTAQKLTYLNQTKVDIKEAINDHKGLLTAQDTFRSYADRIDDICTQLERYRDYLPSETSEGESITLTDGANLPYSDYVVEGKSEQDGEPSPSIPSEIHSVADDDINLLNINDFPISSNVSKEIKNNHLILTATGTSGAQVVATYVKNVDSSKNYTLSFKAKKIVKGTDGGPYIRVALYGSNDDSSYLLFRYIDNTNPTQGQEYSFTASFTGYKYYMLYFYNNTSTPVTMGEKTEYWDIKFQKGSTATPYSPYNQGTVTIKQRGKNLFDLKSYLTERNVSYTENSDESLTFTTASSLYLNPLEFSNEDISVSLSGTLTTLEEMSNAKIEILNNNNVVVGQINLSTSKAENISGCKLRFNMTTNKTITLKNIQLEKRNNSNYL